MADYVTETIARAVRTCGTNDPAEIIRSRGIQFAYTERFVKTLGFYVVSNNIRYIRINSLASEREIREATAHELSHDLFDLAAARSGMCFRDSFSYSSSADRLEIRANRGSAELLLPDEAILEPSGYYKYREILERVRARMPLSDERLAAEEASAEFGETCGRDFPSLSEIAEMNDASLFLAEYKVRNLIAKGYDLPLRPEVRADYLKLRGRIASAAAAV